MTLDDILSKVAWPSCFDRSKESVIRYFHEERRKCDGLLGVLEKELAQAEKDIDRLKVSIGGQRAIAKMLADLALAEDIEPTAEELAQWCEPPL